MSNPRGRCWCGAWLPKGDEADGITCSNCLEVFDPDTLRLNGFEWVGAEWVHPDHVDMEVAGE